MNARLRPRRSRSSKNHNHAVMSYSNNPQVMNVKSWLGAAFQESRKAEKAGAGALIDLGRNLHRTRDLRPANSSKTAATPKAHNMLAILALILVVLWLLGFFAFHITAAAIHIVLVIALVLIVLHFVRGRRSI